MARENPLPQASLPQMLLRHAAVRGDAPALRQRDPASGAWRTLSWRDYAKAALDVAGGLRGRGLGEGSHVAILAENRIEWVIVQMAASAIGAVTVGIYPTSSADEIAHVLRHGGIDLLVVANDAQRARLPADAPPLVVLDASGPGSFAALRAEGEGWRAANPGVLEAAVAVQKLDAIALMIFTSGSTGAPKGALLSFRNIRAAAFGLVESLGFAPDSEILSYLPLCHVAEQAMTVFAPLYGGSCVAFGGGIPTLVGDLCAIRPTYFSGVPRIWEKLQALLLPEFEPGGRFADQAARDALAFGRTLAFLPEAEWSAEQRRRAGVCEVQTWGPVRATVGMDGLRIATSGAASLAPEVIGFFRALGFPLVELYGMTEACSMMTLQQSRIVPGTVGEPVGAVALRLADDGEILVQGENVFEGYHQNPQATAEAKQDGWLHTGDLGAIEHGQLRIIGRKKDVIVTSGGKNVAATGIETLMKSSPLIEDCVLLGEGRHFLAALVQPALPEEALAGAVANPETQQRIAAEIARLNARLARVFQVRRAFLLPRKLSHGAGELTPTLKMRRFAVYAGHADEIEAIYAGRLGFDIPPADANESKGG